LHSILNFSSKIVENAVKALSGFPGVGQRSALRMVMFLLKRPKEEVQQMAFALNQLKSELKICQECFNVSDTDVCEICRSPNRNHQLLCVVEDMQDVMSIENTAQFNGLYHVLGGIISPVEGIGPDALRITELIKRIENGDFKEIIIALNATIDGDTTTFYLARKFAQFPDIMISTISKGISVGSELEYTDEITLGRSFLSRVPYQI
jgi:recombination protein RecR